jgi:hypothetical protein
MDRVEDAAAVDAAGSHGREEHVRIRKENSETMRARVRQPLTY